MYRILRILLLSLSFFTFAHQQAAATIVQLDITIGSQPAQAVYIELLDQDAPATVANFLNYIENGAGERRYDNTFIHRLSKGFQTRVIQLGGYTFDPSLGGFEGAGVSHIEEDGPAVNEFSPARSNVRGTIAMAKFPDSPNSAKSEWFFNYGDNSANLDVQNGGFTVFGRVLGIGMDTVDAIANLEIQEGSFPALPVTDYTAGDDITLANLVKLDRVLRDPPAAISPDTMNPDFGQVELNTGPATKLITIENIGSTNLVIGSIGDSESLSAPFSVTTDNCSNQTLGSLQTCTITAEFTPATTEIAQDRLNIPSNAGNLPGLVVTLSGTGVSQAPLLEVTPSGTIELPNVVTGETKGRDITIRNSGGSLLFPGDITITGADSDLFSIVPNDCASASLALDETCTFKVEIVGTGAGIKTATLQIEAAPDNQIFQAHLSGRVTLIAPEIQVTSPITVGNALTGQTLDWGFGVRNVGSALLTVTNIEVLGSDASLFTLGNICIREIRAGFGCGETLAFTPTVATDSVDATIRITSDDSENPVLEIPIEANAGGDSDGIADRLEDSGPNGGDGNNDGILDSIQSYVASLPSINGEYVTIETAAGQLLAGTTAVSNPSPDDSPTIIQAGTLNFSHGFFEFTIDNVPTGSSATATIYLPENSPANTYFKYGITPGNPFFNHWYEFSFDGETGAEFLGDRVVLHFIDGGRGDGDLVANGRIVDPGGPATISIESSSSGGGGGCTLSNTNHKLQAIPFSIDLVALITGILLIRLYRPGKQ